MRDVVLVLALAAATLLLAQSPSSYRITRTYTLGGDGGWDYIVPDPPNHRLFIGRQNRVMVVDEDTRDADRRSHRHPGCARNRSGGCHGSWIRHVGQRPVRASCSI